MVDLGPVFKWSRLMDHSKTGHFRPFEYQTVWVFSIQMKPVFGCPVIGWLLYSRLFGIEKTKLFLKTTIFFSTFTVKSNFLEKRHTGTENTKTLERGDVISCLNGRISQTIFNFLIKQSIYGPDGCHNRRWQVKC